MDSWISSICLSYFASPAEHFDLLDCGNNSLCASSIFNALLFSGGQVGLKSAAHLLLAVC